MTIPGAIGVDAATAPVQGRAGLRKFQVSSAAWDDWQAEQSQPLRVIFGLQYNVGENHPVAAEPTLEAKAFGG